MSERLCAECQCNLSNQHPPGMDVCERCDGFREGQAEADARRAAAIEALSEEKAQEVERRLRAEGEVRELQGQVETLRASRNAADGRAQRAENACALAEELRAEEMETARKALARADKAERALDAERASKRTAFDVLDGCREVVEKTIIPALERVETHPRRLLEEGEGCVFCLARFVETHTVDCPAHLSRGALAAARKLLED